MSTLSQGILVRRPDHDPAPAAKVPATIVSTWPVATFGENVGARPGGDFLVSIVSEREIAVVDPHGKRRPFVKLPRPPTGMSLIGNDLFVNVGEPGTAGWSVYRV